MTTLVYHNPDIVLGYHISKLPSLHATFERMLDTPLTAYQIYSTNSRGFSAPKIVVSDLLEARRFLDRNNKRCFVHASLLYNMCGSVNHREDTSFDTNVDRVCKCLTSELDVSAALGGGSVVHIGSCRFKDKGVYTITKTIEDVLTHTTNTTKEVSNALSTDPDKLKKQRRIYLENCSAEGNKIGASLKEIASIIDSVDENVRAQVSVCYDTAHSWGAGEFDFGNPDEIDRFYSEFDELIGLDKLGLFHFNDSRATFGSHRDLHENLGWVISLV
jgi:endonuclease IV